MYWVRLTLLAAIAAFSGMVPSNADDDLSASIEAQDINRQWEAVGRINLGQDHYCTGALIDVDLVLTAAHCLYDHDTGLSVDISDMEFFAGWQEGQATAQRRIRRAIAHPLYQFALGGPVSDLVNDVAVLELDQPISRTTIRPFSLEYNVEMGDRLRVVSYKWNRVEIPSFQDDCHALGRYHGLLVLSCTVDFGSSGAPVFTMEPDGPRIVSVVAAKAFISNNHVSLGTSLRRQITVLRRMVDGAELPSMDSLRRSDFETPSRGGASRGVTFVAPVN